MNNIVVNLSISNFLLLLGNVLIALHYSIGDNSTRVFWDNVALTCVIIGAGLGILCIIDYIIEKRRKK